MAAALNRSDDSYQHFNMGLSLPTDVVINGQISRNFGMQPPATWVDSQMSKPGPMTGGSPILSPTQFSHGVMW